MNTKALALAALSVAALAAWHAAARQAPAAPRQTAVAVINLETVNADLQESRDLKADLQARVDEFTKLVERARADTTAAEADLKELQSLKNADPKEVNARRVKLIELKALADARRAALQRAIDVEEGEILAGVYAKLTATAADIAKAEGYDLVLTYDPTVTFGRDVTAMDVSRAVSVRQVLYANTAIDITKLVVDRMNNDYAANKGARK